MSLPWFRDVLRRLQHAFGRVRRGSPSLGFVVRQRWSVRRSRVRPAGHDGGWRWVHDLPSVPITDLVRDHLAELTALLDAAEVDHFVVPPVRGERPQIGFLDEHAERAVRAVQRGLRGRAWYVREGGEERLVSQARLAPQHAHVLYPRYRAQGTSFLTGDELSVGLTPWVVGDSGYVPAVRNRNLPVLAEDTAVTGSVIAYGRRWPTVPVLATPHADAVAALPWLVRVPSVLRDRDARLADALGRAAARSVWFHADPGSHVGLLDHGAHRWCTDASLVVPGPPDGDEVLALAGAWSEADGAVVVLPAGGILARPFSTHRLVSPGGLGLFAPDPGTLGWVPDDIATTRTRELLALRDWFAARVGVVAPWSVSSVPVALPAISEDLRGDLRAFVSMPDRPRVSRTDAALTLLVWWANVNRLAVPAELRAARYHAGSRGYARAAGSVTEVADRPEVIAVDTDSLLQSARGRQDWHRIVRGTNPVAAPWEAPGPSFG